MTGNPSGGRRLLYLYRGDEQGGDGFKAMLEERGWEVTKGPVSYSAPLLGVMDVFRRTDLGEHDVVAAAEYYLTWAVCLRLLFRRKRPKIAALGFNQSKRLVLTGIRLVDW